MSIKQIILFIVLSSTVSVADDFPSIPGWEVSSDLTYYTIDNLWEYIDGAADQFIDYNMQDLRVREFTCDSTSISIDIYDMRAPLSAFGIYSLESRNIEPRLAIGAEAVISPPSLALMVKGRYYVKIYAFEGELSKNKGESVLKAIADALPGENHLPAEISRLPVKNQIHGTTGFIQKNYLGLTELNNCLFADYKTTAGERFQYFMMIPDTGETIGEVVDKLGDKWQKAEVNSLPVLIREIPYQGYVGIIISKETILGVSGFQDREMLINYLRICCE